MASLGRSALGSLVIIVSDWDWGYLGVLYLNLPPEPGRLDEKEGETVGPLRHLLSARSL